MGKRVTACDRVKTCAQKKEPGPRRHAGASLLRKRVVKGGGGGGGGGWCLPARCDIKSRKDTGRFLPFWLFSPAKREKVVVEK